MMKKLSLGLLIVLIAASPVRAATGHWTVAGWYEVADTIVGAFVWTGPYASEDDCKAHLTPNEEDADYSCSYLSERPSWDN
jgi:hypothetical protein